MRKIIVILITIILIIFTGCKKYDTTIETQVISESVNIENDELFDVKQTEKTMEVTSINDEEGKMVNQENDNTEELSQYGLPLVGNNIFDPKELCIGETVMGLKLTSFEYLAGTKEYPFDSVVATFEGEVIITGTVGRVSSNSEVTPEAIYFSANEESTSLLPISCQDIRVAQQNIIALYFNNQEEVDKSINILPGESIDNVKIKINNYSYIYIGSTIQSTVSFLEVIRD